MLIDGVRPTTLDGVKSLAAQIRKTSGVKHSTALDLAAKAANFENFRNARRVLLRREAGGAAPHVFVTMYWYGKGYRGGRETLRIELSQPILDMCGKHALKLLRGWGGLRMVADDHFVCDVLAETQDYARRQLGKAERSIRFMERTGLRPAQGRRKSYSANIGKLPNSDHSTEWTDPATGQFILVDEPYGRAPNEEERAKWAATNGWQVTKTTWPGMYYPFECDLYVATDVSNGFELDAIISKINAMPTPLSDDEWTGMSSASLETFLSPMAKTPQDERRARCKGTIYPAASATSVPYRFQMGVSRRRPRGQLGVEGHIEAGSIIKAIIGERSRAWGVYTRMNSLRSTLEDWMSLEIGPDGLPGPEFFDVYYHRTDNDLPFEKMAKTTGGIERMLQDLKARLEAAYADCGALRREIHRIDMSLKLMAKVRLH